MTTTQHTVTAIVTPYQTQTADDVLAAALGTQHERSLIEQATAVTCRTGSPMVLVEFRVDPGVGAEELQEMSRRLSRTPSMGVDSLTINHRVVR